MVIEKKMKPISLDKALEHVEKVDFFVLDVEGHELDVSNNDTKIKDFLESKNYKLVDIASK